MEAEVLPDHKGRSSGTASTTLRRWRRRMNRPRNPDIPVDWSIEIPRLENRILNRGDKLVVC
jgi:hypothetical protein